MKWTSITIWLFLVLKTISSYSTCEAHYDYASQGSELEIIFDNNSNADGVIIHHYWDLGDGNTSTATNPTHLYSNPGCYLVSLTIITSTSCVSSYQRKVYVAMLPSSDTCEIDIQIFTQNATFPAYNNGNIHIESEDPVLSFNWSTGSNNNMLQWLEPGVYTVTITNNDGCMRSESIEIGYNNNCFASFIIDTTTYSHTPGAIKFNNNSSGEVYQFLWDFGDGTYSNLRNPLHIYEQEGVYTVCLQLFTYYGCNHSFCKTVVVNEQIPDVNISGSVYVGNNKVPIGMTILFLRENEKYNAVARTPLNNGDFQFTALNPELDYLIYAIPDFNLSELYFPKYLPAYSGNSIKWQQATHIDLPSQTIFDIYLPSYNDVFYGNGHISGTVSYTEQSHFETEIYQDTWFDSINSPLTGKAANTVIILQNSERDIINFCLTNNLGAFDFNDLPFGDYILYCEKAGLISQELHVTITEDTPFSSSNEFIIKNSIIQTDIKNNYDLQFVQIYPNPASNFIVINNPNNQFHTMQIFTIDGKLVEEKSILFKKQLIGISNLHSGAYVIVLIGNNYSFNQKLLKKS
jgi:PKD repeat protein